MTIRVLHIASFLGNIGDNINHMGLYNRLRHELPWEFECTRLEMREFFRKERRWDQSLVDEINSFDLCMIGGGNYFELWVDDSPTGTSVGLSTAMLERITTPIVFHALGCDDGMGASASNIAKFSQFIDFVQQHPEKFLVSLRNDGSSTTFREKLGEARAAKTLECPDCGFFYKSDAGQAPDSQPTIGINIAGDMLEQRFGSESAYRDFVGEFATLLGRLATERGVGATFFCHIYKDLRVVSELLHAMPDRVARGYTRIAPYQQGDCGASTIFGEYHRCSLILANRFHANVYPLANGIPVIPLVNYPQISKLYGDLELDTPQLELTPQAMADSYETLCRIISQELGTLRARQSAAMEEVCSQGDRYFATLREWLTGVIT